MEALVEKLCNRFCGVTGMNSLQCYDSPILLNSAPLGVVSSFSMVGY